MLEPGLVLGMTYPYTFHAMVRQARHMILAGKIGKVRQVHVEYVQEWATAPDDPAFKGALWRRDPAKVGRASAPAPRTGLACGADPARRG